MIRTLQDHVPIDERRRQILLYLLSASALAAVPGCASISRIYQAMPMPKQMPDDKSIFQYRGHISVNGVAADLTTMIMPGDVVETADKSEMIFVVGKDSFLMREQSRIRMPTTSVGGTYGLERGKTLGVFASRQTEIRTPSAVIAIKGTGIYLESEPELTYVCTCYGLTDISVVDDPNISETVKSEHHDAPKYVLADPNAAKRIVPAPFKNHDDQELLLIETLVGRSTPYVVPQGIRRTRGTYR